MQLKLGVRVMLIRGYPRIHVALIDLAHATRRRYGGVGFALDCCPVEVKYEESLNLLLSGFDTLDIPAQKDVLSLIERMNDKLRRSTFNLSVRQMLPQHVGLGSKTALLLSIAQVINAAQNLSLTTREIQQITHRGGTSGIGIHTFFCGGVVTDGGHIDDLSEPFMPSGAKGNIRIPPRLIHMDFPSNWDVALLISSERRLDATSEMTFFEENTPIRELDALELLSLVYHGLMPGIAERRLCLVKDALIGIRRFGFKAREINAQHESVRSTLDMLDRLTNCAAGMSSLGPLVYVIYDENDETIWSEINTIGQTNGIKSLFRCKARNSGFDCHL